MYSANRNKAVPGLFPHLEYQSGAAIDIPVDAISIDSLLFQQVVNELPVGYKNEMSNDKFYLSRLYNQKTSSPNTNAVAYESFEEYDRTLKRETRMRQRLETLENVFSNNGIKLPKVENAQTIYTHEVPPPAQIRGSSRRSFMSLFRRRGSDTRQRSLDYSRQILMSPSNHTAVIDDGNPECDFIDYRYEKKAPVVQEEIEPVSTWTIEFIDGSEENQQMPKKFHNRVTIQRKLKVRHLQMISLGATIGVGLFLNSGKAFSIGGPLGAFIGYVFGGLIILATLLSFAEIVALIPLITGMSGLSSRFVGDAFGFSVGWCHWLSYAAAFPSELIASTIMLTYYPNLVEIGTRKSLAAITITVMVIVLTSVNLMDVRVYGEFEYYASAFKLLIVVLLIILMIVLNVGGLHNDYIGFRYWEKSKSPFLEVTFGPFRPTFDLKDRGDGAKNGISGFGGVILSFISSTLVSVFSYVGSEIGFVAAGEAENPRKAVPSVTKRIFTRVIVFYLLSIFVVGLNFYSGDPRLMRYYAGSSGVMSAADYKEYESVIDAIGGLNCNTMLTQKLFLNENSNQSPWVIALQSFKQCTLSSFVNGVFVAIGISAASSQLYASSRTLYSMATQQKAPAVFTWCNKNGVPYMAVLFCAVLGFLSLLCLNMNSSDVFVIFINIGAMGSVIMWFGMNLSFLRFYYALKRRPDIVSRDSKEYPYKSPLQPYLSIFGMISTILLLIFNGFQNFFLWETKNFISSYLTVVLFALLYVGYGWIRGSKINKLEQIDLDSGRREMDRIIWKEGVDYSLNVKELMKKIFSYL